MTGRPGLRDAATAVEDLGCAVTALGNWLHDLAQDPAAPLSRLEDTPELIAEALTIAIRGLPDDCQDDRHTQLAGALARYLEDFYP